MKISCTKLFRDLQIRYTISENGVTYGKINRINLFFPFKIDHIVILILVYNVFFGKSEKMYAK